MPKSQKDIDLALAKAFGKIVSKHFKTDANFSFQTNGSFTANFTVPKDSIDQILPLEILLKRMILNIGLHHDPVDDHKMFTTDYKYTDPDKEGFVEMRVTFTAGNYEKLAKKIAKFDSREYVRNYERPSKQYEADLRAEKYDALQRAFEPFLEQMGYKKEKGNYIKEEVKAEAKKEDAQEGVKPPSSTPSGP